MHQKRVIDAAPTNSEIHWTDRRLLPMNTAATIAGVSRASLYRFSAQGRLTLKRFAGRTLVDTASLLALLDSSEDWSPSDQAAAATAARSGRAREAWQ